MNTISVMRSATIFETLAVFLTLAVNVVALAGEHASPALDGGALTLQIIEQSAAPVLSHGMPGTEGNRHGFEGGCVLKRDNAYHLFVSEMVDDPFWVKMKLAHWSSPDGRKWKRLSTLMESSGNYDGTDPRAAVWAPMPVYSDQDERWNLFYVAYRCAPDPPDRWLTNHEGRIWRAVSQTPGPGGYGGPYRDSGIVLEPGAASDAWEGLQGTDQFLPSCACDHWLAFYGSANTQNKRMGKWQSPQYALRLFTFTVTRNGSTSGTATVNRSTPACRATYWTTIPNCRTRNCSTCSRAPRCKSARDSLTDVERHPRARIVVARV